MLFILEPTRSFTGEIFEITWLKYSYSDGLYHTLVMTNQFFYWEGGSQTCAANTHGQKLLQLSKGYGINAGKTAIYS